MRWTRSRTSNSVAPRSSWSALATNRRAMRKASSWAFGEDEGGQALGFRFLFRGEIEVGHERLRAKRGVDFQNPSACAYGAEGPLRAVP